MGAGGPQGSGRTNAGGHKRPHRSYPRPSHSGPYSSGRAPTRPQQRRQARAIARTPTKASGRSKYSVGHAVAHTPYKRHKRITEDSPKWNAKTMGNKSGKQGGKLYLHGQEIHPKFPITNLREFYSSVRGNAERSFKNKFTNPKVSGGVGVRLRDPGFSYTSKVGKKPKKVR